MPSTKVNAAAVAAVQGVTFFPKLSGFGCIKKGGKVILPKMAAHLCRPTRVVPIGMRNREVFELFEHNPEHIAFPVMDHGHIVGVLNRDAFMRTMARPFHKEIFGKKRCVSLMDSAPVVVEGDTTIPELAGLLDKNGDSRSMGESFVIVNQGFVGGIGLVRDVFQALMYLERQTAEELRRHHQHLEDLVEARTAELVQAEAHAKLILESSADGLYGVDLEGRVTFVNPAACRILGYSENQMHGQFIHALLHLTPDGVVLTENECGACRSLREGKLVSAQDDHYWHAAGHAIPVLYSSHPIFRDGHMIGQVISFVDMSEREKFEVQRALLAAIVSSSEDAIVGCTQEGRITTWNDGACDLFGYQAHEALGHSLDMLVPSECHEEIAATMARLMAGERITPFETWRQGKSGHRVPVLVTLSPIRDRNQRLIGASQIFRDISMQKAAEAAREKALQEAEKLAQAKSEFLANMSHEIRTPLNGVLGMAQVGLRDKSGKRAQECFSRIIESGKLLMGVINDILDFSRIEAGRLAVEQVDVDLYALLEQALNLHRERARAKGLVMRIRKGKNLPSHCLGDPLRLGQILANLLSNAVKFTQHGEISLFAELEQHRLILRVKDSGIGIAPEQIERIFRPFEQADSSTTRLHGGTGLGLAITLRIVELLGGEIRVESELGRGSVFEVCLPFVASVSAGVLAERVCGQHQLVENDVGRLQGVHILVAEDNELNRLVLKEMLGRVGAHLTLAEDGLEALMLLRLKGPSSFDAVLMDVQMPRLDGYEASRQIRVLAPRLPIIGLTAHALPQDRAKCLEVGMVDHLAKPVDEAALLATVLKYLPVSTVLQ